MPNLSDNDLLTCEYPRRLRRHPGIIGALQAMETIKLLAELGSTLKGKLLVCDFTDMDFTQLIFQKTLIAPSATATSERLLAANGWFGSAAKKRRILTLKNRSDESRRNLPHC